MSEWFPPPGDGLSTMQVGRSWDVVQAPGTVAPWIRSAGFVDTAHIICPADECLLWLVPCGSTEPDRWAWERISRYATVRTGHDDAIQVPHADQTTGPGPHWGRPDFWPGNPRGYLTDALALNTGLEIATLIIGPPAHRCAVCERAVWPDEYQLALVPRGPTAYRDYAHPLCARAAQLQAPAAEHGP
ncbi:hypothetical protein AB0I22_19370 [Streptomyces sp. NPDC050610]|uniref:hypothetical protein n=1 Tax=Streptomyces sp. NPDC050610 TaxID=3157097 RepID=UPI00343FE34E